MIKNHIETEHCFFFFVMTPPSKVVLRGTPSQGVETALSDTLRASATELRLEFLVARPHYEYGFARGFKQHPTLVSDERGGFKHHHP